MITERCACGRASNFQLWRFLRRTCWPAEVGCRWCNRIWLVDLVPRYAFVVGRIGTVYPFRVRWAP